MIIKQDKHETTALTAFLESEQAIAVMQHIADLNRQIKDLEAQDKEIRHALEEMMDRYGVQGFENDILRVTYRDATTRESVDTGKLRNEYPDVYENCKKISQVKPSVTIKVK